MSPLRKGYPQDNARGRKTRASKGENVNPAEDVVVVVDNEHYKILFMKVRYDSKVGSYVRQVIFDKRNQCELSTLLEWSETEFAELVRRISNLD